MLSIVIAPTAIPRAVESLDQTAYDPNNEAMSYRRAAQRVKAWRRAHDDMNQVMFAKRARISVGCLQWFEGAKRATREQNLVKIAHALGLTKDQLLADDDLPTEKPDPLLKDLRQEDLRIANLFHHADADAKHAIKRLLTEMSDDHRERLAVILARLLRLEEEALQRIEGMLNLLEHPDRTDPRIGMKQSS